MGEKRQIIETPPTPDGDAETGLSELAADTPAELRIGRVPLAMHGQRLDKLLVTLAPEFSRSHLQHLLQAGHVQLEGRVAGVSSQRVKAGQNVQLALVPTEESLAFKPEPMALSVLHEDEHLLVLDKPAGLVVHPAPGNWSGTLLNGLLARHPDAAQLPRAGIVHRLDKDTSGLMMVGRSLAGVTALVRDIGLRQVHRRYLALVHGEPDSSKFGSSFRIDSPIGRDPRVRVRMAVVAGGKASRTDVQWLASDDGISALSCTLHTGRTHQIRVHLASIGHPLVADAVYGGRPALGLIRQALHATELQLAHPLTRAPLTFSAPLPGDLREAWRQLGVVA